MWLKCISPPHVFQLKNNDDEKHSEYHRIIRKERTFLFFLTRRNRFPFPFDSPSDVSTNVLIEIFSTISEEFFDWKTSSALLIKISFEHPVTRISCDGIFVVDKTKRMRERERKSSTTIHIMTWIILYSTSIFLWSDRPSIDFHWHNWRKKIILLS